MGSLVIIAYWCYEGRRTGNEYILIGVAVTSTLIFSRKTVIFLINFLCIAIFVVYKIYDATQPFVPDPAVNYEVMPMIILISTVGVIAYQMAFFRDLTHHYDRKLSARYLELNEAMELQKETDEELLTSNEELKASNDQLYLLTNQLELTVQKKSTELQSYIDAINVNIYSAVIDAKGKITEVNEPLQQASGYNLHELVGQNFTMLGWVDHPDNAIKEFWTTTQFGIPWRGELKNKKKDGTFFWIDTVILPIRGSSEVIDYFLTLSLPITERKLYEQSREETIRVLESIAFNTSHNIRGPLARIQGLAGLIQKENIAPDEFKWVAGKMLACAEQLNNATTELVGLVNTHSERRIES
jgi:PAS domain S-box-containing protein